MVEVKRNKLSKTRLAIVITSAVLVFLIAGYAVLSAVLPSIANKEGGQVQKEPVTLMDGEFARYDNNGNATTLAYAPIVLDTILSVEVSDSFVFERLKDSKTNLYNNYYSFSSFDKDGKKRPYNPEIIYAESGVNYNDFYATDNSLGYSFPKITMALTSVSTLAFVDRIEPKDDSDDQLARYGLDKDHRTSITVKYFIVNENSEIEEKELVIHVGNKIISGKGYYYMIGGRKYVYVTSSIQLENFLGGPESFLHSRVVAEGLPGDNIYGPFLTQDYKQWTNTYYGQDPNGDKQVPPIWEETDEVIVVTDIYDPIYDFIPKDDDDKAAMEKLVNGYSHTGYSPMSINLEALRLEKNSEASRIVNALLGKDIKSYEDNEIVITYLFNSNVAEIDQTYNYYITKIEAIVTEKGDIEDNGYPVGDNDLIRVTYTCKMNDSDTATSAVPMHAVLDLSDKNIDVDDVNALRAKRVGDEFEDNPIHLQMHYNKENSDSRSVSMFITDIIYIQNRNSDGTLSYASEITSESIVKFAYKYVIDGKDSSEEWEMLVDLTTLTSGRNHELKEKLEGLGLDDVPSEAVYSEQRFIQYMQNFQTYRINDIKGAIEREMVVSFEFVNPTLGEGRDPFYAESIYKNTFNSYPLDAFACQTVTFLLGGVGNQSSNMAGGLVGNKTVAIGLTPENMETYGLYDGYTIYFELPRGIDIMDGADKNDLDNFTWAATLGFKLYISESRDGKRYIASDMYDVIVEVDAGQFDFLEKSFGEYWARKNLAMVDYLDIDSMKVDLKMDDIYGSYDFDFIHGIRYVINGNPVPAGTEGAKALNVLTVRTEPLSTNMSDSVFARFIKNNPTLTAVDIANIYDSVAGVEPGKHLMVRNDTAGSASFKNILQMIYNTNFIGSLDSDEAAKVVEERAEDIIMSMRFTLIGGGYHYAYDFYRISDRKVMVHIYRVDDAGNFVNSVKDTSVGFYISSFAAKKIVNAFGDLLNGVMVNPDVSYWN